MTNEIAGHQTPNGRDAHSQQDVPTPHSDNLIKPSTILKVVIDNVLIWLFWGSADYFNVHNRPHLTDLCFTLFYIALVATFAIIANAYLRRPTALFVASSAVCLAIGYGIFFFNPWPTFARDAAPFLAVVASISTALLWYRTASTMSGKVDRYREETVRLRAELNAAKQSDADLKMHSDRLGADLAQATEKAELDRRARIELERQLDETKRSLAPRRLTAVQQEMLSRSAKTGDAVIQVIVTSHTAEVQNFSAQIIASLTGAGYRIQRADALGLTSTGVCMAVALDNPDILPTARKIVAALNFVGIGVGDAPAFNSDGGTAIQMYIGEKHQA